MFYQTNEQKRKVKASRKFSNNADVYRAMTHWVSAKRDKTALVLNRYSILLYVK